MPAQHRPNLRTRRAWLLVAVLGLVNVTIAFAAMFAGVDRLATGTASVLANAQPLLILLPAWWLYAERPTRATTAGLLLGFGGLVAVGAPFWLASWEISMWWSPPDGNLVLGGLLLAGWAWAAEGPPGVTWSPRFVGALLFLSLVGTAGAFVVWFTETQRSRFDQLTPWTFLVPVVGIVLAATVLGERPTGWTLSGLSFVLVALAIAVRPRRDPRPADAGSDVGVSP